MANDIQRICAILVGAALLVVPVTVVSSVTTADAADMISPIASSSPRPTPDSMEVKIDIEAEELYQKYQTNYTIIRKIVKAYGLTEGRTAVHVAFCESSHDPGKTNGKGSTASGLFQIIRGTWDGYHCTGNPFNADDNIACSYKLYQADGWNSSATWEASSNCWKGDK